MELKVKKFRVYVLLFLVFWVGFLFFQGYFTPDVWHFLEKKDEFTRKVNRTLSGRINAEKFIGLSCDNQNITLAYLQDIGPDTDYDDDLADLYIKVGQHNPLKFADVFWTRYKKVAGIQFDNRFHDHEKELRELLIELQGPNGDISIGVRGRRITDNAKLSTEGLSESLTSFLQQCGIRLDNWPDPSKTPDNN